MHIFRLYLSYIKKRRTFSSPKTGSETRSHVSRFPPCLSIKALEESAITYWQLRRKLPLLLPLMATAAAAAAARPCLMDPEAAAKCSITVSSRQTIHFSHHVNLLHSLFFPSHSYMHPDAAGCYCGVIFSQ